MSKVTNLLISFSNLEDSDTIIQSLKSFNYNGQPFEIVSIKDENLPEAWYGGNRKLEGNLLVGAYNYLDLIGLIEFIRGDIFWEAPEYVQIIVKEQDDFKFRLIDVFSFPTGSSFPHGN